MNTNSEAKIWFTKKTLSSNEYKGNAGLISSLWELCALYVTFKDFQKHLFGVPLL